jgi:hypothetical protein
MMADNRQAAHPYEHKTVRAFNPRIPVFRHLHSCNKINSLPTAAQAGFEKNN